MNENEKIIPETPLFKKIEIETISPKKEENKNVK